MAEIKFEKDFEGGEIAKPVGRLQIGDYTVRLVLCPDGVMRMIIPANAKTDGSIIWSPARNDGVTLYGFYAIPEEARRGDEN
jgi:hypothetical protein